MKLFLVAGEASADIHAAALLRELRVAGALFAMLRSRWRGSGQRRHGAGRGCPILNVVGISDWFDKVGEVLGSYRKLCRLIRERRPDCAVLLDLPDFNLRMAKKLKALGVPVVYYISPQVWAWRKYRLKTIQKYVDRMLVVFPFRKGILSEKWGRCVLSSAIHCSSRWRDEPAIALRMRFCRVLESRFSPAAARVSSGFMPLSSTAPSRF